MPADLIHEVRMRSQNNDHVENKVVVKSSSSCVCVVCVGVQPLRALERAGRGEAPLVAHGTRDNHERLIITTVIKGHPLDQGYWRNRWAEDVGRSHEEWSKWEKDFFPQFCQTRSLQLARRKRDFPMGHLTLGTLHQQHIKDNVTLKKKKKESPFYRGFFMGCIPQSQCLLRPRTSLWCTLTMKGRSGEDQLFSRGPFILYRVLVADEPQTLHFK